MAKKLKEALSFPDLAFQDGARSQRSVKAKYKEATQKFFARSFPKAPYHSFTARDDISSAQSEADDKAPLEDPTGMLAEWDKVSAQTASHTEPPPSPGDGPESTLKDIMAVVTGCTTSITVQTAEIKGVKAEVSFVRQDMQKLRERTAALEGRFSSRENGMEPLLRDVKQNVMMTMLHALMN